VSTEAWWQMLEELAVKLDRPTGVPSEHHPLMSVSVGLLTSDRPYPPAVAVTL
jgi:hypothetical protein